MSVVSKDSDHVKSPLKGITGIILAGGKSSRYGVNKAFIEINGVQLIERVITVMGSVFERLILITNTPHEYAYLNLPMYEDLIKGLGPIGGILTGLKAISDESGFFVACDMPFINGDLIHYMVEVKDDYDAVVPRITWKMETLHALYRKSCLTAIRELIESNEYQTIKFFNKVHVRYVDWDEIRAFD
ncbi:MAG: molybdenum cofactor guanylyltransferase, partial [Deltaproteobacteria bacterium]|nr:molybdenum cofactor guanylyltransferase [Deltaproteobacteria bacterium]